MAIISGLLIMEARSGIPPPLNMLAMEARSGPPPDPPPGAERTAGVTGAGVGGESVIRALAFWRPDLRPVLLGSSFKPRSKAAAAAV